MGVPEISCCSLHIFIRQRHSKSSAASSKFIQISFLSSEKCVRYKNVAVVLI